MPFEWEELRPLGPARIDAATVKLPGEPESHGFRMDTNGVWRREDGWRAGERRDRDGYPWTYAQASAETCARYGDASWEWCDGAPITRLDIKRDAVNAPVWPELSGWLCGHRRSRKGEEKPNGFIVTAGSRNSGLFLRIYVKTSQLRGVIPPYLAAEWAYHGWRGEPVTRVEYELKDRYAAGLVVGRLHRQVPGLWADSLARLRLCKRRPELYAKAANAPTCAGWRRLGEPEKMERPHERRDHPEEWAERAVARMLRSMAGVGVDIEAAFRRAEGAVRRAQEPTREEVAAVKHAMWVAEWDGVVSEPAREQPAHDEEDRKATGEYESEQP